MQINVKEIVDEFIEKRFKEERFDTLVSILNRFNISYRVDSVDDVRNVVISFDNKKEDLTVIGAHYDVFGSSIGINDNTCAVAMLIKYAYESMKNGLQDDIEIVFFDKEEDGGRGSLDYVKRYKREIKEALLFDIIGYGDSLVASGGMSQITYMMIAHEVKLLRYGLPSDNIAFMREDIPVTLITAAPKTDLIDHFDYTYQVKPQAEFYKTFHNQSLDNKIDVINFDIIDKAYEMLKDLYKPNIN